MSLTSEEVAAAAAAWVWIPPYARTVVTDEFTVVRYPDHFDVPLAVPQITVADDADLEARLERALAAARTLDHPWASVHLPPGAPAAITAALQRRGAAVLETLDVLAAPPRSVDVGPVGGVEVETETETDLTVSADMDRIGTEVFGGSRAPEEFLAEQAAGADARRAEGRTWAGVARLDGRAVGAAGATIADGVLRLWGGAVMADARGRGAYRALLGARIAWGVAHGAHMALVKARVETSGPILLRAGLAAHGTEHAWRVEL